MKKISIILWTLGSNLSTIFAQTAYQQILATVEANSPRLEALRMGCEAQQEEARQETVLADPELSFGYLWGDPSEIGHRWDLSVSQSFDFPTAYLHRKEVKRLAIESASLQYEATKREVMLQAKQLCVELAYNDSLLRMLNRQVALSEQLLECERVRLAEGATTVLVYNHAQQQLLQSHSELHQVQTQYAAQQMELEALAGGAPLACSQLTLETLPIEQTVLSFDAWWEGVAAQAPLMQYVQKEVERADQQVRLSKDGWLPGLTVGYMSENTKSDTWRGFTVGVTLPVWNNRHRVKASQLRQSAANAEALSQKQTFMARLKGLYLKASSLQQQASELLKLMNEQQTPALLQQQFDEGSITIADYLSGMIEQVELQKSLLSTEREVHLMWTELHSVE